MIPALAGVLGLVVGSFLNVVIWRVPRGQSIVRPPSACPACGAQVRPYDNVPVVSWLVLRGRCRDCGARISARYPVVELMTAVGFGAVAWWQPELWLLPALLYLVALTVSLTLIDFDHQRLPDKIVLPAYPVALGLVALATWNTTGTEAPHWDIFGRALIGGLAMFVAYALMRFAYPKGMGLGDVKLAGVLGMYLGWYGWGALAIGFFSAFVLGGLFSLALMLAGRAGRRSRIPFGPWMFLGTWIGIVVGESLWSAYLHLVGL